MNRASTEPGSDRCGSGFVPVPFRTLDCRWGSRPPMPPKRAGGRAPITPTSASSNGSFSTPLANALLVAAAVGYGMYLLHRKGTVSWPPHHLLASLYTVAGCLALVGPVV